LEAGRITQEQYESRLAWLTLRSEYLHPERLWAQVLGMSVDDLRAACDEGKTIRELIQAQGLDRKAVRQALEDAAVDQVMKALQDDVVDMEMLVRTWVRGMGPIPTAKRTRNPGSFLRAFPQLFLGARVFINGFLWYAKEGILLNDDRNHPGRGWGLWYNSRILWRSP